MKDSTREFIDKIEKLYGPESSFRKLPITVPYQEILNEVDNIKHLLVPHRSSESSGWNSFCIYGHRYDTTSSAFDGPEFEKDWTVEARQFMPVTVEYFKKFPYPDLRRIRVVHLEPGGYIDVHRDVTAIYANSINIVLNMPEGCKFYMENAGILDMQPGDFCLINTSNLHCVVNNSNEDRYHIIINGENQWFEDYIDDK